jgi:hypothetical protein
MAHIREFKTFQKYRSYYPYYLPSYYSNVQAHSEYDHNKEDNTYTRYYGDETKCAEGFENINNHQLGLFLLLILAFLYFFCKK